MEISNKGIGTLGLDFFVIFGMKKAQYCFSSWYLVSLQLCNTK